MRKGEGLKKYEFWLWEHVVSSILLANNYQEQLLDTKHELEDVLSPIKLHTAFLWDTCPPNAYLSCIDFLLPSSRSVRSSKHKISWTPVSLTGYIMATEDWLDSFDSVGPKCHSRVGTEHTETPLIILLLLLKMWWSKGERMLGQWEMSRENSL